MKVRAQFVFANADVMDKFIAAWDAAWDAPRTRWRKPTKYGFVLMKCDDSLFGLFSRMHTVAEGLDLRYRDVMLHSAGVA